MLLVLRKEVLYNQGNKVIYKTYNTEKDRYGMFIPGEDAAAVLRAKYLYIFSYTNDQAVVVDEEEQYWSINLNWKVSKLDKASEEEYRGMILKNSYCICSSEKGKLTSPCNICGGSEQIFNRYAFASNERLFNW